MKKVLMAACVLLSFIASAGDSLYVKKITDTLASPTFFGRGYVNDGMRKAGNFIATEMKSIGLQVQEQTFGYPVNTFPGKMMLTVNGIALKPGLQFITGPDSKSCKGGGLLERSDSVTWINKSEKVIIKMVDKLTWSVATQQDDYTTFHIIRSTEIPVDFSCEVNAKMNMKFNCSNIIGTIKGTLKPDSIIVFTAHYDHLGAMGADTYFPGANDNAGGVAMMLGLAKYFIADPPAYTVQFIAFAGEEAGLLGSKYYVDHPLKSLQQIRFLVNLDLVGNGDEGITVVNATEFPKEFELLKQINESKHFLVAVNSRGKAANSDHFWFTEKAVPSFFIYTLGKRKTYHDVNDIAATVPWHEVNDLEQLLIDFANAIM